MERLTCGIVRDLLPSYLDDLLSDSVKAEVKRHLESCRQCERQVGEILTDREEECLAERSRSGRFQKKLKSIRHYLIGLMIGTLFPFVALALWFFI